MKKGVIWIDLLVVLWGGITDITYYGINPLMAIAIMNLIRLGEKKKEDK